MRCASLLLFLAAAAAAQESSVQPSASPPESPSTSAGVPETPSTAASAVATAAVPAAAPAVAPAAVPAAAPAVAPAAVPAVAPAVAPVAVPAPVLEPEESPGDDGEDELTERQTLSKAATLLCRTSPRGKNDPNVRGFAYTNNRCVALCRNGYGIPWRQSFTAQTPCGSGMVCVNRECMQAGTSKDMQTCTTIFNQSRRKYRQLFNARVEAGAHRQCCYRSGLSQITASSQVISACRLRCYNPNTAESLRVNRDDGERCQNRLYEGTCRGGICRSPNDAIGAIGSVIPIPYQEANAFSRPDDQGIQVEEPGFGEEFDHDGFHSDRFQESLGERPQQTPFSAQPAPAVVQATNGTAGV